MRGHQCTAYRPRSWTSGTAFRHATGEVRAALLQSPTEYGFGTELWTLKRVVVVIHQLSGVCFGQTQVWRILGAVGVSPQKPEKRAIKRDEGAVRT